MGPYLPIVNPFIWEAAHLTWFQEYWVLRNLFQEEPAVENVDERYDSTRIEHEKRWVVDLLDRDESLAYMRDVRDRTKQRLQTEPPDDEFFYYVLYTIYHDDMHNEAFTYMRQSMGLPAPDVKNRPTDEDVTLDPVDPREDVQVPGGQIVLGATGDEPFVFDNEKWGHEVEVEPFQISRTPVTCGQYREFVEDDGYRRKDLWSSEGWAWRCSINTESPVYWRRSSDGRWVRRRFDEWKPIREDVPVSNITYFEAKAYCRWAGRRLPTEREWAAAAQATTGSGQEELKDENRRYPWGNDPPDHSRANLDWRQMGPVSVGSCPDGESAFGCRQMIGNVWEWTDTVFQPFPGFEQDFYQQYSQPWFGSRYVMRGGSWATPARMIRNGFRNYYTPDRRDVFSGFRTCANQ